MVKEPSDHAVARKTSVQVSDLKEYVSTLLPSISVAALVLVSIFNIGYFSNIGLHFLGLIDLTNIVYSVGLVFGGLLLAVNLLATMLEVTMKLAKDEATTVIVSRWFSAGVAAFGAVATTWVSLQPSGSSDTIAAILLFLVFTWAVTKALLRLKTRNEIRFSELMMVTVAALSADFAIGRAVAEKQLLQQSQLYTFFTKSGVVYGVTLVRSSSSGFIIANNRRTSFLSKDEVKSIVSETAIMERRQLR